MLSPSSPPRRRAHSWALVALVCTLAQLLAFLHMGLVRHERCAAHGELMHATTDEACADAAPGCEDQGGVSVVFDRGGEAEHAHDHCQVVAERSATPARPCIAAPVAPIVAPPLALAPARPRPIVALFRLAPKASPPRVA